MKQIKIVITVIAYISAIFCTHANDPCSRTDAFNAIKNVMNDYSTKNLTGGLNNNANENMLTVTKGHVFYIKGKELNTFCFYDCWSQKVHIVYGAFRRKWDKTGNENGPLGLPQSSVIGMGEEGVCYFENGAIYKDLNKPEAYIVRDEINNYYNTLMSNKGKLGMPLNDQLPTNNLGETSQQFEGGIIYLKRNSLTNMLVPSVKYNFERRYKEKYNPRDVIGRNRGNNGSLGSYFSEMKYRYVQLEFDLKYFDKTKLMQLLQQAKSDYDNNIVSNSIRFMFCSYTLKNPSENHKRIDDTYTYAFTAKNVKEITLNSPDTKINSITYNQQTNKIECMMDIVLFVPIKNKSICFMVDVNKIAECRLDDTKEIYAYTNCYGDGTFILDVNKYESLKNNDDNYFSYGFYNSDMLYPHHLSYTGCMGINRIYFEGRNKTKGSIR